MKIYNKPPRGVAMNHADFEHLYLTTKELYDQLAGILSESAAPTRVMGVEWSKNGQNYSCTEGWLLYNNSLYKVGAFEGVAQGSQVPVFSVYETLYTAEPHALYEGFDQVGNFTVKSEQTLAPSFAASGTGLFDYDAIIDNPIKRNSDAVAKHQGILPFFGFEYYGPLSNFDATGLGIGAYVGFALCNGQNGTPDKRGRVGIGLADTSAANGNLDANLSEYFVIGNVGGSSKIKITKEQLPPHDHPVSDPGHDHDVSSDGDRGSGGSGRENFPYDVNARENNNTSTSTTGITVGNTGNGDDVDIRQSYMVVGYVMKLPA